MKRVTLSLLGLLMLTLSVNVISAKWTCCEDMGGSSVSCEPFATKEECNKYCGGVCQDINEDVKADTSGGVAIDNLDINNIPSKYVMNPTIREAYNATK